jgi:hypothetical protein
MLLVQGNDATTASKLLARNAVGSHQQAP